MASTKEIGNVAENLALEYLLSRGMTLLDRNWRSAHRELDLVMESADRLHIVEVKSLREPAARQPFEAVDAVKQQNLIRAARAYVAIKNIKKEVQFDIVSVSFLKDGTGIEYIPDAFLPIVKPLYRKRL